MAKTKIATNLLGRRVRFVDGVKSHAEHINRFLRPQDRGTMRAVYMHAEKVCEIVAVYREDGKTFLDLQTEDGVLLGLVGLDEVIVEAARPDPNTAVLDAARKDLAKLLNWIPECEFPKNIRPLYGETPPEGTPFCSESYTYEVWGKEDARTFLALLNCVARSLGRDNLHDVVRLDS